MPNPNGILAQMFAILIRLLAGTTVRKCGYAFSGKQAIYYANHSSNLDFPIIWASLPENIREQTRPVAAEDYWGQGGIRQWICRDIFRAILIERMKPTRSKNPLEAIGAAMEGGASVIIFPEGGRSTDGTLQPFKSGIYHLALRFPEAEIVPVFLENLNRILPKGEFLFVPLLSTIAFGAPLSRVPDEPKTEFLKRAEAALRELIR